MAINDCINNSSAKGELRDELTKAIEKRLDELGDDAKDNFKVTVAIRDVTEEALAAARTKKRQQFLKVRAYADVMQRIKAQADDPTRALESIYVVDPGGNRQFSNIEMRAKSIVAESNADLPTLAELRPKVWSMGAGVARKYNDDLRKAGLGLETDNVIAKQLAKEMKDTLERMRVLYNKAGGTLKKLEGWFLPQQWNVSKVARIGDREAWANELLGAIPDGEFKGKQIIDVNKMVDQETGKPLNRQRLREVLEYSYETITTDGLNKWKEAGARTGFANKRDNARQLHFTPEGWMYLNQKYGNTDTVSAFLHYRDQLAHDIAIMDLLGPNPDLTFEKAMVVLEKKLGAKFNEGLPTPRKKLEYLHEKTLGRLSDISNRKLNDLDSAARSFTMATLLQGAFIPSQSDWSHQALANVIQKTKMIDRVTEYVRFMANSKDKVEMALRDGIVADTILSQATGSGKFDDAVTRANGFFSNRAQWVLEKSGLIIHTDAGRLAAINAHRRAYARDVGKAWQNLSNARRAELKSYGISKKEWDEVITVTELDDNGGAPVLSFNKLRDADPNVFRKVHEMMLQEGQRAVISTDARVEARLDFHNKSFADNPMWKHVKMFKRFLFGAYGNIESVVRNKHLTRGTKAKAVGAWFLTGTFIGMLTLQAKQISQGKDPLPMVDENGVPDWRFVMTAMLYGGVLPVLGDVILENVLGVSDLWNPKSESKTIYDFSPTLGLFARLGDKIVIDPVKAIFEGDLEKTLREAGGGVLEAAKSTAGIFGANHWAIKTAMDRWLWSPLEQALDPDSFEKRKERTEKYAEGKGQEMFWPLDASVPERAPTLREALD